MNVCFQSKWCGKSGLEYVRSQTEDEADDGGWGQSVKGQSASSFLCWLLFYTLNGIWVNDIYCGNLQIHLQICLKIFEMLIVYVCNILTF
jgi:hypothetical protein